MAPPREGSSGFTAEVQHPWKIPFASSGSRDLPQLSINAAGNLLVLGGSRSINGSRPTSGSRPKTCWRDDRYSQSGSGFLVGFLSGFGFCPSLKTPASCSTRCFCPEKPQMHVITLRRPWKGMKKRLTAPYGAPSRSSSGRKPHESSSQGLSSTNPTPTPRSASAQGPSGTTHLRHLYPLG